MEKTKQSCLFIGVMPRVMPFRLLLVLVILSCYFLVEVQGEPSFERVQTRSTYDLVTSRGFLAKNHSVITRDGYILNLVQCNNPLVNGGKPGGMPNKDIVLLVHGITPNANVFIFNSLGAHPIDYSSYNASSMDMDQLNKLLANDPNTNSLPFLLLNFGHEVWLLNRRGTSLSGGHVDHNSQPFKPKVESVLAPLVLWPMIFNPLVGQQFKPEDKEVTKNVLDLFQTPISEGYETVRSLVDNEAKQAQHTYNPRYWAFSYDEEIKYDLPDTIDYILNATKRSQIAVLGNSAGGMMLQMLMIAQPDIDSKLTKVIFVAPSCYPGNLDEWFTKYHHYMSMFALSYTGPLPLHGTSLPLRFYFRTVCSTMKDQLLCDKLLGRFFGELGEQQHTLHGNEDWSGMWDTYSCWQIAQLNQIIAKGEMCYFDFVLPEKNLERYNQTKPPCYDPARITSKKMSIWAGNTDGLAPLQNIKKFVSQLKVPIRQHYIQKENISFNHLSFFFHKDVAQLVNIPTLIELEETF